MKSSEYWKKRQLENYKNREKDVIYFYKELEKSFNQVKREIEMIINDFYVRYSENNKINYLESKKLISQEEIKSLKYFINKFYKTVGIKDKEVINISLKARITRYEALQKQIEAVINALYEVDYKEGGIEKLKEVYKNSYYNTLYNIEVFNGFHTEFSILNIRDVETLIEYPFNGANYSDRIWKQKEHMISKLKENITTMLVQGKNPKTLSSDFAKLFKVKKHEAYRLLHTESSFIIEQGTLAAYKEDGVEEYQILATLDTRTSDICREQDNKVYKIDEYVTGSTAPPFHHFCRTTTVPYYGEYEETRKARDPKTNKTYDVPANMTYKEWYDRFVVDKYGKDKAEVFEKMIKNKASDRKQHKRYVKELKGIVPKKLENFQEMKYTNKEEWERLSYQYKLKTVYNLDKLKHTENFASKDAIRHILEGEINRRGKAVGFHMENIPTKKGRVIERTRSLKDKNGVYSASVEIDGILKDARSSFFPTNMLPQQIIQAINEAYNSREPYYNSMLKGKTSYGFEVGMYLDKNNKISSAFPIQKRGD